MPLPLPYFNNHIDPLLSGGGNNYVIKPELYYYDDYQRYDLLQIDYVSVVVEELLRQLINFPVAVDQALLIERFTPFEYVWCDDYSSRIYNFLAKYSGTFFYYPHFNNYGDKSDNAILMGFSPNFFAGTRIPSTINWGETHPVLANYIDSTFLGSRNQTINLTITLPATNTPQRILITWLRSNEADELAYDKDYCSFYTDINPLIITINLQKMAICSMVISSDGISSVTQNVIQQIDVISKMYLFSNLQILLNGLDICINTCYPRLYQIVTSLQLTLRHKGRLPSTAFDLFGKFYDVAGIPILLSIAQRQPLNDSSWALDDYSDNMGMSFADSNLIAIPAWFKFSGITYANNNYWKNSFVVLHPDIIVGGGWFLTPYSRPLLQPQLKYSSDDLLFNINSSILEHALYSDCKLAKDIVTTPTLWNQYIGNSYNTSFDSIDEQSIYDFTIRDIPVKQDIGSFDLSYVVSIFGNNLDILKSSINGAAAYLFKSSYPTVNILIQESVDGSGNLQAVLAMIYDTKVTAINPVLTILDSQSGTIGTTPGSNALLSAPYFSGTYKIPLIMNAGLPSTTINISIQNYIDSIDTIKWYDVNRLSTNIDPTMVDSPRTVEIWELLGCAERRSQIIEATATLPLGTIPNSTNLWYINQRLSRLVGIKVNVATREPLLYSPPQKLDAGSAIPGGWLLNQWDEHSSQYNANDIEDGMVVELVSNSFLHDPFNTGKVFIKSGDYVLINNLLQLEKVRFDTFDKALDLQNLAAYAIPNADSSGRVSKYEGLLAAIKDILYMASRNSEITSGTLVSSQVTQQITKEILAGLGLPVIMKTFGVRLSGKQFARVPYPGLAKDAKSIVKYIGQVLLNLGIVVGQTVKDESRKKPAANPQQKKPKNRPLQYIKALAVQLTQQQQQQQSSGVNPNNVNFHYQPDPNQPAEVIPFSEMNRFVQSGLDPNKITAFYQANPGELPETVPYADLSRFLSSLNIPPVTTPSTLVDIQQQTESPLPTLTEPDTPLQPISDTETPLIAQEPPDVLPSVDTRTNQQDEILPYSELASFPGLDPNRLTIYYQPDPNQPAEVIPYSLLESLPDIDPNSIRIHYR